jgi:hypothetical protein
MVRILLKAEMGEIHDIAILLKKHVQWAVNTVI